MRISLPTIFFLVILFSQPLFGQNDQDTTKSSYPTSPEGYAKGERIKIPVHNNNAPQNAEPDAPAGFPLYIIDGKPVIKKNQYHQNFNPASSNLRYLLPSEIISMKFISPEDAKDRFGERADHGAVMIKTLTGSRRYQPKLSFSGYSGVQWIARRPQVLDAHSFTKIANEAYLNDAQAPPFHFAGTQNAGTNWQDEIFRTGYLQNYHLSINSRKKRGTYLVSGNYNRNYSPVIKASREQLTGKASAKWNIGNHFSIGGHGFISRGIIEGILFPLDSGVNESLISSALFYPSSVSSNSQELFSEDLRGLNRGLANPLVLAERRYESFTRTLSLGQVWLKGHFSNLNFQAKWALDNTQDKRNQFVPAELMRGLSLSNKSLSNLRSFNQNYSAEYNLSDRIVGYRNSLTISSKLEHQYQNWAFNRQIGNGLTSADQSILNAPILSTYEAINQWHQFSGLLRAEFGLRGKYIASTSLRGNISPQFSPNNKSVFLPSTSLRWKIDREQFFRDHLSRVMTNLDIQFSYGISANEQARIFPQLSSIAWNHPGTYQADLLTYAWLANRSQDLSWETSAESNFSLRTAFLNGRIGIEALRYVKNTKNILTLVNTPNTGYEWQNLGHVINKGWELNLDIRGGHFRGIGINANGNITFNTNEVRDLGGLTTQMIPGYLGSGPLSESIMIIEKGQPIGNFYGYKTNGLYQLGDNFDTEPEKFPGDIRIVDMNGDGKIDEADKTTIGNSLAQFFYGYSFSFTRKRFELSFSFKGNYGSDILNYNLLYGRDAINGSSNLLVSTLNRWTPENPNTHIPRPTLNPETRITDRLIEDGSYLRLADVSVSYSLPSISLGKVTMKNVNVYLKGQNLFLFTKYSGFDPEVLGNGSLPFTTLSIDRGAYPNPRSIIFGMNFDL